MHGATDADGDDLSFFENFAFKIVEPNPPTSILTTNALKIQKNREFVKTFL